MALPTLLFVNVDNSRPWHSQSMSMSCKRAQMWPCQLCCFRRETPVFRRPLWPPLWQYLSPFFTFYLRRIQRRPPHAHWWSRCLAAKPPSALLFTYLLSSRANSQCTRCCTIVNMANWNDKSEKIKKYVQTYKDEYSKRYSCLLSHLRATSMPSTRSVQQIYLSCMAD